MISILSFSTHPRAECPAREAICRKCKKTRHYQCICQSENASLSQRINSSCNVLPIISNNFLWSTNEFKKSSVPVIINQQKATALVDSGSTDSFIHLILADVCSLEIHPSKKTISMATSTITARIQGCRYWARLVS